jgi:NAD(P)-dependent dehydrogenase (short-subunit alcohol dehydrogenase family)
MGGIDVDNTGRIVIVTGAAGGIGRALVEILAQDGDTVVAVDLPGTGVIELANSLEGRHLGVECDVSRESDVLALFDKIDAEFSRLDALVNNAAMGPTMTPTIETSVELFRKTLSVNLIGPFVMAREAARRMRSGSAIVNIASLAGVLGNPRRNAYSASKAGLISFTKSLACEWAARGIRVCGVAPGYVRTPMVSELERTGKADIPAVRRRVPMGRMCRPDEIARAARFLASPQARYITGAVLAVDGGWMSFNQPGDAHPSLQEVPGAELSRPEPDTTARVVVVTGGAHGIGAAVAERFARAGDTIVIADKDGNGAEALAGRLGREHMGIHVDVSDEANVVAMFGEVAKRYGKIGILINNAAIADTFMPALDQRPEQIERLLDVNLTGAFVCAREALRAMPAGGVVLNLGSINSFLPFAPRHAYGASKAGIDILTRCMAAELGPKGIRFATIAPGYIRTPGVAALETSGRVDFMAVRRRIPMGDLGRPEDIADAAFFLASADASYINGSILYVDGGWTSFGNAGFASELGDTAEAAE